MTVEFPKYCRPDDFKICGIYLLIYRNKVVYIGKTWDLLGRLKTYHQPYGGKFTKIRVILCDRGGLNYYEKRWIRKFKPANNRTYLYTHIGPHDGIRKRVSVKYKEA